jgi:hypothetical protein
MPTNETLRDPSLRYSISAFLMRKDKPRITRTKALIRVIRVIRGEFLLVGQYTSLGIVETVEVTE